MTVAYISHPACEKHDMGFGHPECPDRIRAITEKLQQEKLWEQLHHYEAPPASNEQLCRVHDNNYIKKLAQSSPTTGYARFILILGLKHEVITLSIYP